MKNSELKVRTGATKRYGDGTLHEIEKTIIHPDAKLNTYSMSNDIGLIKVIISY